MNNFETKILKAESSVLKTFNEENYLSFESMGTVAVQAIEKAVAVDNSNSIYEIEILIKLRRQVIKLYIFGANFGLKHLQEYLFDSENLIEKKFKIPRINF